MMASPNNTMIRLLEEILDRCEQVREPLLGWHLITVERPDVALPLLEILQSADDVLQIVNPDVNPEDIIGLPPETIAGKTAGMVVRNPARPDWDYTTWATEKSIRLKRASKMLVSYYLIDPVSLKEEVAPDMLESFLHERINQAVAMMVQYATVLRDQFSPGGLEIEEE